MSDEIINRIRDFLQDKPVIKAYLFGSHSRSEETEESDIDILVELDHSKPVGLKFIKMKIDLEELLNKKVDLVSSKGVSKYIEPYIEKDKILIYDREDQ